MEFSLVDISSITDFPYMFLIVTSSKESRDLFYHFPNHLIAIIKAAYDSMTPAFSYHLFRLCKLKVAFFAFSAEKCVSCHVVPSTI